MLEVGHQQRVARSIALKVMNKLAVPLNDDQIEKVFTSVDLNKDSQLDSQAAGLRAELPTVNHETLGPNCQVVFGFFL